MYIKRVVVVDHDVNVFDDREVAWALAPAARRTATSR